MTWQEWVAANLPAGTRETSGYRTPQQEAALGGPASSYHSQGTPDAPGAIDVGGPAAQLTALFEEIKQQFAGRVNELYLNLPGGGSQDIRNNQAIGTNPEAGRAQHLHIALRGIGANAIDPQTGHVIDPTTGVPFTAGAPHYAANGAGEGGAGVCPAAFTWIDPAAWAGAALGRSPDQSQMHDLCWSDVWVYGAGLVLVIGGAWMLMGGRKGA